MSLIDEIVSMAPELKSWRRDIHAHPELGFEENRTADFVAARLTEFGIEVYRGIGKKERAAARKHNIHAGYFFYPFSSSNDLKCRLYSIRVVAGKS